MQIGTSDLVMICQHCGRPIGGIPTFIGGFSYHYACTRSPYEKTFQPTETMKAKG